MFMTVAHAGALIASPGPEPRAGGTCRHVRDACRFGRRGSAKSPKVARGITPRRTRIMAKGQKKSNKEARKPKAEKPKKQNASNPSQKEGVVRGLDNMKK